MKVSSPELIRAFTVVLGNEVVMSFKAQGYHWNVAGNDFSQFHDFFQEIYEDVHGSIDATAESILKLGATAPYRLVEFARATDIQDAEVGQNAMAMCKDLYDANEVLLGSLYTCLSIATSCNEQGHANFLAGRIEMQEKWRWQLSAYLTPTDIVEYGL
jgi:starvation-inducible DNA-binding protein